ncbi:MAG TPA: hypothetical protein PLG59_05795 [bacterium]|nr:hypothetical protein [bacterium]
MIIHQRVIHQAALSPGIDISGAVRVEKPGIYGQRETDHVPIPILLCRHNRS